LVVRLSASNEAKTAPSERPDDGRPPRLRTPGGFSPGKTFPSHPGPCLQGDQRKEGRKCPIWPERPRSAVRNCRQYLGGGVRPGTISRGVFFATKHARPRSRGRHCIDTGPQIANFLENKNRPHWPWVCNRRPPSARRSLAPIPIPGRGIASRKNATLFHAGCSVRNLCRVRRVSSAEPSSQETNFEAS
jgi:hypothetical protein